MYMNVETKNKSTFNDIPVLLANIDEKLGVIVEWIQNGASQQDPHAILTIDDAVAFTGYSKSAIHSATSKDTIPHFKRGNKLFFFKDELAEWLKSDNRPKRGKRFRNQVCSKEPVVTDGNNESVSIAVEIANDTNSLAGVADTNTNQSETTTSVPAEAVSVCQSPEIVAPPEVVSDAELEQNGSSDESNDTSNETTPTSGTDVDSYVDKPEELTSSNDSLTDKHISYGNVQRQGKENAISSFPFFSLERHEATDASPAKSVIQFFDKVPYEQYHTICKIAEEEGGKRIAQKTICFEFDIHDDALQAAQSIDKYLSGSLQDNN